MTDTSIEWCARPGTNPKTWNPTRGCSIISPGCARCYAMRQAHRHSGKGRPYAGLTVLTGAGPVWTGEVREVPAMLPVPLSWRSPATVFVDSMSDLFHDGVSDAYIAAVFGVMAACPQHTFIVLTKRAARMRAWFDGVGKPARGWWLDAWNGSDALRACRCAALKQGGIKNTDWVPWPLPNVWLLVSVEDQPRANERIPELLATPAVVRGISAEPLLELVNLELVDASLSAARLDWVIVGGESGPGARPFNYAWARSLRDQCATAGFACFIKQLGACQVSSRPLEPRFLPQRSRKGSDPIEWPADLRVREFPQPRPIEQPRRRLA